MGGFTYTTKDGLKQTGGEIHDRVYVERTARDGSVVGHVEFLRPKVDETLQQAADRQTIELAEMGWYPPLHSNIPHIGYSPATMEKSRAEIQRMIDDRNLRLFELERARLGYDPGVVTHEFRPRGWDDETPIPYELTEKGRAFCDRLDFLKGEFDRIGIVARHAKDQRIANEMSMRLAIMTGRKPRKYTRWQLFRSRMSMRFDAFRERVALCIAPWIRDE